MAIYIYVYTYIYIIYKLRYTVNVRNELCFENHRHLTDDEAITKGALIMCLALRFCR